MRAFTRTRDRIRVCYQLSLPICDCDRMCMSMRVLCVSVSVCTTFFGNQQVTCHFNIFIGFVEFSKWMSSQNSTRNRNAKKLGTCIKVVAFFPLNNTITTFITYIKKNIIFGQDCNNCTIMSGQQATQFQKNRTEIQIAHIYFINLP